MIFEGVPTYPHPGRLWEVCDKHSVSTFYTAPTALRSLMVHGDGPVKERSLKSLRLLGTVGEPINPETWMWYFNVVGKGQLPIVDTWWQTETGGIMVSPLPGATPMKPGSATLPFFGVNPKILREDGSECAPNEGGNLVMKGPGWPGIMRTVFGDSSRFKDTYFSQFPGYFFTGDGARLDEDGYLWIMGRTDDVLNVSGHRIGSAEVESAIVSHSVVTEAAVVGVQHAIKGEGIYCFVTVEAGIAPSEELRKELIQTIRKTIGPIATPDAIQFTQVLPKTRSGKIMRRLLRKVASGDTTDLGDVTTLADSTVVDELIFGRVIL